jgi:predicted dehydrogenase
MGTPLRFGIVGLGVISGAHVHDLLNRPEDAVIVAASDPIPARLDAIAERVPGVRAFDSIEALLSGVDIDAVVICTPHYLHTPQALAAVRRGIPAFVEKPVTCDTAELRELHAAAEKAGVFVQPGQNQRFAPEIRRVRARMEADPDLLGRPRTFAIDCLQDLRVYARGAGTTHWLFDGDLAGGGITISVAVHKLDLVRHLTGADYERVYASARYEAPFVNGAESAITATLQLTDDLIGTLHGDYLATRAPYSESLKIIGTNGTLAVTPEPGTYSGPLTIATAHSSADESLDPESAWSVTFSGFEPIRPMTEAEDRPGDFDNQFSHFIRVIRDGVEPIISLEKNFNTIAAIEALTRSARENREIEVERW